MILSIVYRLITPFALMIAMTVSGFVHTGARPDISPELAAYVAAGGSLADICGGSGEQDGARGVKCDACLRFGAAVLPHTCHSAPVILSDQTRRLSFVAKRILYTRPLDPTCLARAPPQA
ncbi:hypothetical protein [Pseudosulfitobacter sp. SM2401]|uniref:hypothetical protein n=1 Tax=Pseudosulfitobacter sp. SM2401 TaxID=3350098 RepID=UPI0036F2539C